MLAQRVSSCPRGCFGRPGHSVWGCGRCVRGCVRTAAPWWWARDWLGGSRRWSSRSCCLCDGLVFEARPALLRSLTHTSLWRRSCPQTQHGTHLAGKKRLIVNPLHYSMLQHCSMTVGQQLYIATSTKHIATTYNNNTASYHHSRILLNYFHKIKQHQLQH